MPRVGVLCSGILLLSAAFSPAGAPAALAQQTPPPEGTFAIDVNVVNVFVAVRDKSGRLVKDLAKEDFTLREDGRKQTIRYFSRETGLPLTIGLIVDTTPSETNMLDEEKRASLAFLEKMLRPSQDRAFLIQFGYKVEMLAALTSSRETLARALDSLGPHQLEPAAGPGGSGFMPLMTVLADSIYLASEGVMKKQSGRKAFIILGDGFHLGDRAEKAIAAAQRADTLIYTIGIFDTAFAPGGGFGLPMDTHQWADNLKMLSQRTGGAYFEASRKQTLDRIYGQIEEELRSQYSLGYTPDSKARRGYRRIKIAVRPHGMTVRGREGYYPRP
jgi:VWFA-related protein